MRAQLARNRKYVAILAALAVIAFAARFISVARGGGLYGDYTYDDGVYFGSAFALLHGRVEYRDFLFLHPPGITYLLAPFAALGLAIGEAGALAVARLGFMALGSVNTVLVGLVGERAGRKAALCAAAFYAVWEVPAFVERTTWLVAPQTALLLLGLLVLTHGGREHEMTGRRAAIGGALLGGTIAMQLWGALPFGIVLAWLIVVTRRGTGGWIRAAVAYVVAGAAVVGVVCLPFFVATGPTMLRYLVVDQIDRAPINPSIVIRARGLVGFALTNSGGHLLSFIAVSAIAVAAIAVAVVAWRRPVVRLWAALLAAETAFILANSVFFAHYAGWLASPAALCIGAAVAFAHDELQSRGATVARAFGLAFAAGLAVLFVYTSLPRGTRLPLAQLRAALAGTRCVTADSPILLIETGRLHQDLDSGCELELDTTGVSHDTDRYLAGTARVRTLQEEYQGVMEGYYTSGDAAMFLRSVADGLAPDTLQAIDDRFPQTFVYRPVTVFRR